MSTSALIQRHISDLPFGKLFTTRDLVVYGSRTAVDTTTCRLVKERVIQRIARGVFTRFTGVRAVFAPAEIARTKATAFGKKIMADDSTAAHSLGFAEPVPKFVFAVDGRSTSFGFDGGRIYLRAYCPRRLKLGDDLAGTVLRALWHLGWDDINEEVVAQARRGMNRFQLQEIQNRLTLVPEWINAYVCEPWRSSPLYKERLQKQAEMIAKATGQPVLTPT